jgi:hypothetical protein
MTPNPGTHLKLKRIKYSIDSMVVQLQWKATSNVDIVYLSQGEDILDFVNEYAGGWPNNAGSGVTGGITLTTIGQVNNSAFTIILELIKGV